MLTAEQVQEITRTPLVIKLFDGFDVESSTIQGPFPCVGDCVSDCQRFSVAYIDALGVRSGDLGIWFMPSRDLGEQYACKWLVTDSTGRGWLACKYFAVRYRSDFHRAVGRVVALMEGESGTFDDRLSRRLIGEMEALRASPPCRDDVVVFAEDLLDHAAIVAEIDRRQQQH